MITARFKEPDSTELLSSGSARHWPDARGIFFNGNKDLFVWVNEEDHLRIVSTERGDGIRKTFIRFATACTEVQKALQSEGKDFMHNDHHGYILASEPAAQLLGVGCLPRENRSCENFHA